MVGELEGKNHDLENLLLTQNSEKDQLTEALKTEKQRIEIILKIEKDEKNKLVEMLGFE